MLNVGIQNCVSTLQFDEKISTLKFSRQIAEFTVLDLDI